MKITGNGGLSPGTGTSSGFPVGVWSANAQKREKAANCPLMEKISEKPQESVTNSILSSSQSYADTLRTNRQQAKNTSLNLKKLKYQFKNISAKILRSKTSASAKQVVGQVRREILRLKREKQSGSYSEEEIEAAITHAKAMERVARKKVKHLEEEELAEASGGLCADIQIEEQDLAEKENDISSDDLMQENPGELSEADFSEVDFSEVDFSETDFYGTDFSKFDFREMDMSEMDFSKIDMSEIDFSEEMLQKLNDAEEDVWESLLEESGIEDLVGEVFSVKRDMDPADLHAMKIKHRNKEMKEIAKADAEYLKAMFDFLEKSKETGMTISLGSTQPVSAFQGEGAVINITL